MDVTKHKIVIFMSNLPLNISTLIISPINVCSIDVCYSLIESDEFYSEKYSHESRVEISLLNAVIPKTLAPVPHLLFVHPGRKLIYESDSTFQFCIITQKFLQMIPSFLPDYQDARSFSY